MLSRLVDARLLPTGGEVVRDHVELLEMRRFDGSDNVLLRYAVPA